MTGHLMFACAFCVVLPGTAWMHPPVFQPDDGAIVSPASFDVFLQTLASKQHAMSPARVEAAVKPVLEAQAMYWNSSFSFGFTNEIGSVKLAAGINDMWSNPKKPMAPETSIPVGSTTKSWTAIAILQYVEKGTIGLNDLASKWVDPVLRSLNSTTFSNLYPGTESVTIGDLLSMSSGLGDYDDGTIAAWTLNNAGQDLSPIDMLHLGDKSLVCVPKTCVSYSSLGYELLGLALVKLQGVASWEDVDQFAIVSPAAKAAGRYSNTLFPLKGSCLNNSRIAHQYTYTRYPYIGAETKTLFFDLIDNSCLNGWTCGNMASTGGDLATFYYDLFHGIGGPYQLVNIESLKTMLQLRPMSNTWCPGCLYGAGLIFGQSRYVYVGGSDADKTNKTSMVGHPGQDWGSGAPWCGYNSYYNFGACIVTNSNVGMNASLADQRNNLLMSQTVTCEVYNAILSTYEEAPTLNCSVYQVPPPIPSHIPFEWRLDPPLPVPVPSPPPKPLPPPVSPSCFAAVQKIYDDPLALAALNKVQKYDTTQLEVLKLATSCKIGLLTVGSCNTQFPWSIFPIDVPVLQNVTSQVSPTSMVCSLDMSVRVSGIQGYPARSGGYHVQWALYTYYPTDVEACTVADGNVVLSSLEKDIRSLPNVTDCKVTWTAGQASPCTTASAFMV